MRETDPVGEPPRESMDTQGLVESFPTVDRRACEAAERYLAAAAGLEDSSFIALKMFTLANLFLWHLDAFERDEDPIPLFVEAFDNAAEFLRAAAAAGVCGNLFVPEAGTVVEEASIGKVFGEVYSQLPDEVYFEESYEVLRARLESNGISPDELFRDKVVLDAGCGGGKFSAAMARLGARKVIGVDISEKSLEFARDQATKVPYGDKLDYRFGSVLQIPLDDESVDIAWSNSVIHLTGDYDTCIRELTRVLRPSGTLYIYVNSEFGLFGLLLGALQVISKQIPESLYRHYLTELGVSAGRISWMVPSVYLPYRGKPRREVEALLRKHGLKKLRRLTRGIALDQIEQVSAGLPFAEAKYGEAQLKYLATKAG